MFIKALRNIKAGEELNYDYGLIIDEPYTKKLKAEYPVLVRRQELPRHAARAQATAREERRNEPTAMSLGAG